LQLSSQRTLDVSVATDADASYLLGVGAH
jgi:hypothetical protein